MTTYTAPAAPDYSTTSLETIVVEKDRLLTKLRENRQNHESIYQAACSGYWQQCATVLENKKEQFADALTKLKKEFKGEYLDLKHAIQSKNKSEIGSFSVGLGFHSTWPISHPTNHLEDYDQAINMLEFSVADKVTLSRADFNAYVRNDWNWNKQFVSTNLGYVQAVTGCYSMLVGISGCSPVYDWAVSNSST